MHIFVIHLEKKMKKMKKKNKTFWELDIKNHKFWQSLRTAIHGTFNELCQLARNNRVYLKQEKTCLIVCVGGLYFLLLVKKNC